MANMMDYLDWRGDLSFEQAPFNEVDNLILAELSYVDLSDSVHGIDEEETTTIKEASGAFWEKHTEEEINATVLITLKEAAQLLRKLADCPRFANLKLSRYVNRIDYKSEKQFSAVLVELDARTVYVAYRGTDDTIVGWKEDFNMSFLTPVPSQIDALSYLETVLKGNRKRAIVGGHSKGGNLAVYAAVMCRESIKKRIVAVYNNDGPGFDKKMVENEAYRQMLPKIHTIVPQSSVIGMLLEHEEAYEVVKSTQTGLMQHDATSWEIIGPGFVYLENTTKRSQRVNNTLKNWINGLSVKEREKFVDVLFGLFDTLEVKTVADLTKDRLKKLTLAIKSLNALDAETKSMMMKILHALLKGGKT